MKLLVIGATGMIGSRVVAAALARGHTVTAAARKPGSAADPGLTWATLDATNPDAVAALATEADAVASAVSPRGGGAPKEEAMAVADALIEGVGRAGKRLLVVGGAGSLTLPDGRPLVDTLPPAYRGEALAMRAVLDRLKSSDLDWTFFSPAAVIEPGPRTGRYRLGGTQLIQDAHGVSRISAEDYAEALVNELEQPAHRRSQMTIGY